MNYTTSDGVEVPKPNERKVHRGDFYKSSLGLQVRVSVVETIFPQFIMLTGSVSPDDGTWDSCLTDLMGGIVTLRLNEGYTLDSLTARSAVLRTTGA